MKKEKIIEDFWPRLARIAASYEQIPQLQQELVQEMGMAIWQALSSFRGDSSLDTFLYRIAHNVAVSHIKKQVKQITTTNEEYSAPSAQSLEQTTSDNQSVAQLMSAIRQLPLEQRQVVTLYLDGVKQKDIAEVLGMTENNIGVRINRAKQSLALLLAHEKIK